MFQKILIANRGEIACRIYRTCRKMGIQTIAVYSEADAFARHRREADEAYLLPGITAAQTYLKSEAIIDIAKKSGAEAVHPGYGFLSENAAFAKDICAAGLAFIGPSPQIIRQMGDKITAKEIAHKAKVPLVPGTPNAVETIADIEAFADKTGYPILIKAAAGGGGKGMRVVWQSGDIPQAFTRAKSEAMSSFKDSRVFVEKYINRPRHIEIQIMGDKHGNLIHLGERDCSLQRRHQKVIEETPSPILRPDVRGKMIEAALALGHQIGYDSAGTVEFIMDEDQCFYFLEMNTRLQVEHPITEAVTRVDLVEAMITVASGAPLPYTQEDIHLSGHAVEARLYAEDPSDNFMPSSGRLTHCHLPTNPKIRVDSGVESGDEISVYYDPMIAKMVSHGETRIQALKQLSQALGETVVDGVRHNAPFLNALLQTEAVQQGRYHTHFIEELLSEKRAAWAALPPLHQSTILLMAAHLHHHFFPAGGSFPADLIITIESTPHSVTREKPGVYRTKNDTLTDAQWSWIYERRVFLHHPTGIMGQVQYAGTDMTLIWNGQALNVTVMPRHVHALTPYFPEKKQSEDLNALRSPMPGVLISLPISVGDRVQKGQTLAVIEAMKMENTLTAAAEVVVTDIFVKHGDSLMRDQIIAKFG